MGPLWEDADGEEIVNETFTRLEKAFHAIFSERDAVASNLLRASVTSPSVTKHILLFPKAFQVF